MSSITHELKSGESEHGRRIEQDLNLAMSIDLEQRITIKIRCRRAEKREIEEALDELKKVHTPWGVRRVGAKLLIRKKGVERELIGMMEKKLAVIERLKELEEKKKSKIQKQKGKRRGLDSKRKARY